MSRRTLRHRNRLQDAPAKRGDVLAGMTRTDVEELLEYGGTGIQFDIENLGGLLHVTTTEDIALTSTDDMVFTTTGSGEMNFFPVGEFWVNVPTNSIILDADGIELTDTGDGTGFGNGIGFAGKILFENPLSPATITSDQNDYTPDTANTWSMTNYLRLTSDAPRNITGLAAVNLGDSGRFVCVYNVGSNNITFVSESASSTSYNRFSFDANITLKAGQGIILQYDHTSSRWRASASTVTAPSGSAGGDLTGTYPNPTVADGAVSYAKIQDTAAASVLLGRGAGAAGDVQELTVGGGLSFAGTLLSSTSASGGTPALTFSTTGAAGSSGTFVRDDDQLALFDTTVPTSPTFGDSAATGSVGKAARRDHIHGVPETSAGPDADITVDTSGAVGNSHTACRSQHGHKLSTSSASPVAVGTASPGTSATAPSRGDHVHPVGTPNVYTADTVLAANSSLVLVGQLTMQNNTYMTIPSTSKVMLF